MQEEIQRKIDELNNKVGELEKKLNEFSNPTILPEQMINSLVQSGFVRYVGPNVLTYTNPSGREFWSGFFQFKDNQTLINLDKYSDTTGVIRKNYLEYTASTSDTLTSPNHGLSDGQQVWLYTTGNMPTGLSSGTIYFVINSATNTFRLSESLGGAAINITATGSPYNYVVPI
jgi:hypothetical protein